MGAGDSPEYKSSKEKAEKLQQKLKELKEEKEGINAQISNKENKNEEGKKEEDKEEELKAEKMQQRIGEIDKQINEIDEQLNTIYSGMDFNSEMDAGDGPETPPPESEELQAKIKELQEQQKKLKEEKERINAQISNKKDKKEEDKKEEGKKEDDKTQDDKKQDDKKQEDKKQDENLPAIEFRKISFSLLDNEGKYNPNYTVEYSNGMQQKFKPTKYKSKKDERKARRNIKSGIKRLFEKYNVHISGAKVKKLMKHMDIDFLAALGEYKDDSLCAQYLFATYAKLKGITGKDVDLPYALEYDTRTLNAENIDKAEAKQYNKLAKRMNKIGLVECQTEPSFLRKLFKPKKAMLANTSQSAITDTSRMTIDEQIAWYKENQNDPNFNRITYMSQLRKSGYSEEEIDQIRDGIKPSNSEQYRESKRVPKEQLTPIPKKSGNEEGKGNDKNNEEELENV